MGGAHRGRGPAEAPLGSVGSLQGMRVGDLLGMAWNPERSCLRPNWGGGLVLGCTVRVAVCPGTIACPLLALGFSVG